MLARMQGRAGGLFGFGLHPLAELREESLAGPGLTERDYRAARRLGVPRGVASSSMWW